MVAHASEQNGGTARIEKRDPRAGQIERNIERKAAGQIYGLQVDCGGGQVVLRGRCRTYYAKQLAQEAALDLAGAPTELINQIIVS